MLASRSLAHEARDVHHQFVDFLRSAAKELAERQLDLRRAEREVHQGRLESEELPKVEQAALKLGLKESEKFLERDKPADVRSEEHTSELQSQSKIVCRLLLVKKKKSNNT